MFVFEMEEWYFHLADLECPIGRAHFTGTAQSKRARALCFAWFNVLLLLFRTMNPHFHCTPGPENYVGATTHSGRLQMYPF
jgi:hypothetical protein